jgi:hypothetical protein
MRASTNVPLARSTSRLLLRRARLLILNLQIIHDLLHVGHTRGTLSAWSRLYCQFTSTGQRDYAALHFVFHVVVNA